MLRLDIPITKVDAARRLVFGVATAEIADRAGEVCDYASTKPFYERWSEAIAASSGGRSLGNLRAMHGAVAAGKVTALTFNDEARQIEICAKVVDEAEWTKVAEGVYTGFSQGGTYARRWTDEAGVQRYTADPHEISLVDLPCLSQATFEMIKADGSHERRPFKAGQPEPRPVPLSDAGVAKVGARNSAADQARVQKLHDTAVDLGAVCDAHKMAAGDLIRRGDPLKPEDLLKREDLTKHFDALTERLVKVLEGLSARLTAVEEQPQPLPFAAAARSVGREEDAGRGGETRLDGLLADPGALSLLAIKLAQRQRR